MWRPACNWSYKECDEKEIWINTFSIILCQVLKIPIAFSEYTHIHKHFCFFYMCMLYLHKIFKMFMGTFFQDLWQQFPFLHLEFRIYFFWTNSLGTLWLFHSVVHLFLHNRKIKINDLVFISHGIVSFL